MGRLTQQTPTWRTLGAALAAFAVGAQLVLSAWLIGQVAATTVDQELQVLCSHQPPGPAGDDRGPPQGASHDGCLACACPQSASLLAPPPAPPSHAVPRPRSQAQPAIANVATPALRLSLPYLSRAPPQSA
jgi:hypothetical protein